MRVYYSTPPFLIPHCLTYDCGICRLCGAQSQATPFSLSSPAISVCHSSRPRRLPVTSSNCSTPQQPAMQQHKGK